MLRSPPELATHGLQDVGRPNRQARVRRYLARSSGLMSGHLTASLGAVASLIAVRAGTCCCRASRDCDFRLPAGKIPTRSDPETPPKSAKPQSRTGTVPLRYLPGHRSRTRAIEHNTSTRRRDEQCVSWTVVPGRPPRMLIGRVREDRLPASGGLREVGEGHFAALE